ncbi:MAG: sigma-70 family RNA polymerase sigma factor [Planctomycetota bacterium]
MVNEPLTAEIIKQVQNGNHRAFKKVVETYQTMIFNLAYRMTYNRDDASDLCQEIFFRIYQKIHTFDISHDFTPWCYKVAGSVCLNWKARPRLKTVSLQETGNTDEVNKGTVAMTSDITDLTKDTLFREKINKVLAELSEDYRLVIVLHYLQGMSYDDMAKTLSLPMGTIKIRLFRAREILKERLTEYK